MRNGPNSRTSLRTKDVCEVLRAFQLADKQLSPIRDVSLYPREALPTLTANCRLTHQEIRYLTKLLGKQGEDAGSILRDFHAKAASKASRFGCTAQQIGDVALQDVEMLAIGAASRILPQPHTGQMDWEYEGQSSSPTSQRFAPPTR